MSSKRLRWTFSGNEGVAAYGAEQKTPRTLTADDIRIVYQPIVDLKTGGLFAYEALTRCTVPELQNPAVLFEKAAAEKSCGRLGRLVREQTFKGCPGVPLFINVHPDELAERWLVRPDDPLAFSESPVFIEITETAAFQYFDLVMSVLKEVCSRTGAQLVVDDFGAGYSNLRRIIDLHPQIVKLDRALVAGLDQAPRQQALVRHMVSLCEELGARVVAEGIETPAELRAVREAGVQLGQGYVIARPAFPPPRVGNVFDTPHASVRPAATRKVSQPPVARRQSQPPNRVSARPAAKPVPPPKPGVPRPTGPPRSVTSRTSARPGTRTKR